MGSLSSACLTDAVVTAANYTTDEMVETSCHIISEQLVATATATVSSAFSDLCRTDQVSALLVKLENKYIKELDSVRYKVDRILKHFMISENDSTTNSTS
uniref:Putative mRNA-decapping protein n=2 Tax=Lygus hesperus TaxID=30085 RepID=A0A0A9X908_LYGHE